MRKVRVEKAEEPTIKLEAEEPFVKTEFIALLKNRLDNEDTLPTPQDMEGKRQFF